MRYFLLSEVPFGSDGDYSEVAMLACANGFLANALGNLQMRVVSLISKNCNGRIPDPGGSDLGGGAGVGGAGGAAEQREGWPGCARAGDLALLAEARGLAAAMAPHMDGLALHRALACVDAVVRHANRYVDAEAPWALRKTDPRRMRTVLWVLADTLRHVATCCLPFMPRASDAMLAQLGVPEGERGLRFLAVHAADEANAPRPGAPVPKPASLFPRIAVAPAEAALAATTRAPKK